MTLVTSGSLKGRCPVCGAIGAVCGPTWHGNPIDIRPAQKGDAMALIKVQDSKGNTFQMTKEDAERNGFTPVAEKAAAPKATEPVEPKAAKKK